MNNCSDDLPGDVEYIAVEIDDQIIYITSKKEKCRQSWRYLFCLKVRQNITFSKISIK